MQPARSFRIANGFADRHGESDHVVLHFGFEFVDAGDVNFSAGTQRDGRVFRNFTSFGQGFGSGEFNIQPFLIAVRVTPDTSHFFAGIARYHVDLSKGIYCHDTAFASDVKPKRAFADAGLGRDILACGA